MLQRLRLGFRAAEAVQKRFAPLKGVSAHCNIRLKIIHFGPTQPAFVGCHDSPTAMFHLEDDHLI
jgi:hypothetical protein